MIMNILIIAILLPTQPLFAGETIAARFATQTYQIISTEILWNVD